MVQNDDSTLPPSLFKTRHTEYLFTAHCITIQGLGLPLTASNLHYFPLGPAQLGNLSSNSLQRSP